MAQIPNVSSLGARPIARTQRAPKAQAPEIVGYSKAIGAVGKEIRDQNVEDQEKLNKFNYLKAKTELNKKMNEAQIAIAQEQDFSKHASLFERTISQAQKDLANNLEGDYKDQFQLDYDNMYSDGLTNVKIKATQQLYSKKAEELEFALDENINNAVATSDPYRQAEIQTDILDMIENTPGMSQEKKKFFIKKASSEIPARRLSLMPKEQVEKYKSRFSTEGGYSPTGDIFDNIPADEGLKLANARLNAIELDGAKARADARIALETEMDDYNTALSIGAQTKAEPTFEQFTQAYKPEDVEEKYAEFQDAKKLSGDVNFITKASTEEITKLLEINKPKTQDNAAREYKQYEALKSRVSEVQTARKADPIGYAETYGMYGAQKATLASDFSTEQAIQRTTEANKEIFNQRMKISAMMSKENGSEPAVFKSEEIEYLKSSIEKADSAQAISFVTSLGQSMNDQQKQVAAKQINAKDPYIATLFSVTPEVASVMVKGQKTQSIVEKSKFMKLIADKTSGVIIDPDAYNSINDGLYNYYKGFTLNTINTDGTIDPDAVDKTIEAVMGKITEVDPTFRANPSRILSWQDNSGKFVSNFDIESSLSVLSDEEIANYSNGRPKDSRGNDIDKSKLLEVSTMVSTGVGRVSFHHPTLGDVVNQNGERFEMDLKKLLNEKKVLSLPTSTNPLTFR